MIKKSRLQIAVAGVLISAALWGCTDPFMKVSKSALGPYPVESLSFGNPAVYVDSTQTTSQAPVITPANATNKSLTWSSSNPSVATVDATSGVVTPVTISGTSTIKAAAKDGSGVFGSYTVNPYKALTGLSFSTTSASKTQGSTLDLSAYLTKTPTDANEPLVWTSSNGVASVDSTGKLKVLLTAGTAQITTQGQYSGVITSIPFSVTSAGVKVGVTSVSFSSHSTETMSPGSTYQRLPSVLPAGATDPSLTWVSSNTSVATVASDGTVKMISTTEGDTAVIRATSNDNPLYYDQYSVTPYIAKPLTSFDLSSTSGTLSLSGTKSVTISYTYAPSNTTDSISNYYIFPTDLSLTVTVTNTGPGTGSITITANSTTGDSYYYFGNSGSQHAIYQIKVTN